MSEVCVTQRLENRNLKSYSTVCNIRIVHVIIKSKIMPRKSKMTSTSNKYIKRYMPKFEAIFAL